MATNDRPSRSTNPLPLRGRAECVASIDALLAGVRQGHGSVLIIEGPPGIGKSRLLSEVEVRARRMGARTLRGRAYEEQQTVPFAPLLEAMTRTEPPVCDADVLRRLSATADARFWAIQDLQRDIAAAAAVTPMSIAIDDLHWADAGTTLAVRALVTALVRAPILWTFAMRSVGGRPEVRDAVNAIASERADSTRRMRLGTLDVEAARAIAADALAATVDDSVEQAVSLAHGNPFLIIETLRGLDEEGRIDVADGRASTTGEGLPHRLAATMQQRLDRLSPTARRTVHAASMLPESFSVSLLARVLGQNVASLLAGIEEAVRADLLTGEGEQFAFRHQLLRAASRETLPRPIRRAMEREIATIQLELGSAPEEVAVQLARSAEVGDVAAVGALRRAAQTLSTSDPSGAADLSRRALELLALEDAAHAAVVNETIVLLNRATRFDEAQLLATATLTAGLLAEEEAQIRLSLSIVSAQSSAQRVEQNRRALALPGVSAPTRARNRGWLAYNLTRDGQPQAAAIEADGALRAADDIDDLATRLIAETALVTIDCAEGRQRRCLDAVSRLQQSMWTAEAGSAGLVAATTCAAVLITLGQLADAEAIIAKGLEHTEQLHNSAGHRVFAQRRALCELAAGRLDEARDGITASVPEDERFRPESVGGRSSLLILGAVAAHTGDRALLRVVDGAARRALAGDTMVGREATMTLAQAAWQRGDDADAARWLGEELDLWTTPTWPMDLDFVVLAARIARVSGDAGLRRRVVNAVDVLQRDTLPSNVFGAVALHARGLLEGDVDALDQSVRILAESARPLLHAAASADLGLLLATAGDRDGAAARLTDAFDVYSALGASADGRRTARQLGALGVHRRVVRQRPQAGWDSLTESEVRVFELVAEGATNREAANTLGVSPHTVNTQLRNVFGKLGFHSRAELISWARER